MVALPGEVLSTLIVQCIDHIHATGVKVRSLTLDALAANVSACKVLGCDFSEESLKSYFEVDGNTIHIFLDVCHVLKLLRNILGEYDLIDKNGSVISWKFFRQLVDIQLSEGQHLGNRLTPRHIEYQNNKMSTCLAAQTYSRYRVCVLVSFTIYVIRF